MISTDARSSRFLLAASLAFFTGAGVSNASLTTPRSAGAAIVAATGITLTVGGVYALARYARRVDRKRLAVLALALWTAFLCIAAVEAIGIEGLVATVPAAEPLAVIGRGLTWATMLGAGTSTAFLAFREYGASTDTADESVLEGDAGF